MFFRTITTVGLLTDESTGVLVNPGFRLFSFAHETMGGALDVSLFFENFKKPVPKKRTLLRQQQIKNTFFIKKLRAFTAQEVSIIILPLHVDILCFSASQGSHLLQWEQFPMLFFSDNRTTIT